MGETTAANVEQRIRAMLLKERQTLIFSQNNTECLKSPLAGAFSDAKNGPLPKYFNVIKINGNESMICEYQIETWLTECPDLTLAGNPGYKNTSNNAAWLSNTWTEAVEMDENLYSRRTRVGKLTFDMAKLIDANGDVNIDDDAWRDLVTPQLLTGFTRIKRRFAFSEDLTQLLYEFVDQEKPHNPPFPATLSEARFTINCNNGAIFTKEAYVKLNGSRQSKVSDMIGMAMVIAVGRIAPNGQLFAKPKDSKTPFLQSGYITDGWDASSKYVEVQLKTFEGALNKSFFGFNVDGLWQNNLEQYFNESQLSWNPDAGTRGTTLLKMLAPKFNDPCMQSQETILIADPNALETGHETILQSSGASTATLRTILPNTDTQYTEEDSNPPYTDYHLESKYEVNQHRLQVPVMSELTSFTPIVTLAGASAKKYVYFTAERIGDQPLMPFPISTDTNEVLLENIIQPVAPAIANDGISALWRISGLYIYGILDINQLRLRAGTLPYVNISEERCLVANFTHGITDPGQTQDHQFATGGFTLP